MAEGAGWFMEEGGAELETNVRWAWKGRIHSAGKPAIVFSAGTEAYEEISHTVASAAPQGHRA